MHLVRALITAIGSGTLPAFDRPRVVGVVWVSGHSGGTGAEVSPVRRLKTKVRCGSRRRQGSVALQGMTGRVSHQEAQCAAKRSCEAERRPSPPKC